MNVMNQSGELFLRDEEEVRIERGVLRGGVLARLSEHPDGRSAATELLSAPAILREGGGRMFAIGPARIATDDFSFRRAAGSQLAAKQVELRRIWLDIVLFEPARARIAYLLLTLDNAHPNAEAIPARLSYTRIANLSGVTERSVDRCFAGWVRQGAVLRTRQGYRVRDAAALRRELGESGDAFELAASGD